MARSPRAFPASTPSDLTLDLGLEAASPPSSTPTEVSEEQAEDFLSLWLPFEIEIGCLTRHLEWVGDEPEQRQAQIAKRREILERLFVDVEAQDAAATRAFAALETLMQAFAARVQLLMQGREWEEQGSATPGEIALQQLSGEADFLQLAAAYNLALGAWLFEAVERSERVAGSGACIAKRTQKLARHLKFHNDSVHGVAVRGIAQAASWARSDDYAYAFNQTYAGAKITMGLREGQGAQDIWLYLVKGGARMIKAHYALWARFYENFEEGGSTYLVISVPQFCADLGYTLHKNGGFRPEHKREALEMLHALTSIEMSVSRVMGKVERRLRGPLWTRGIEAEEREVGQGRGSWEPTVFSYAPGVWFSDPQWRAYHRHIGKIGSGLLKLSTHTDQWPILIGGYLGTLARTNAYEPFRVKVGTLLGQLNLAQGSDYARRQTQAREKLERALDRLAAPEIGVITSWEFEKTPEAQEIDLDDPNALAQYGVAPTYPPGDWRSWVIRVEFPFEDEAKRLSQGRKKAVVAAKKRAAPRKKSKAESVE